MSIDIWSWLTNSTAIFTYGYVGIFSLSFVSSLIVFVPIPYFIPIIMASIYFDPNMIAFSSALGATLAKTAIFRGAYLGRRLLNKDAQRRLRPFEKMVSRYGWLAAFIAAATPIPDDIVYIPLGFTKYNLWRFIVATFLGKLILTLFITWGARFSLRYVKLFIEGVSNPINALIVTMVLAAIVTGILYIILRLDWNRIIGRWFPWAVENSEN